MVELKDFHEKFHKFEFLSTGVIIYTIVFVSGLLANLCVIFYVLFDRRNRSITNKFIMNLALSDLLTTIICIPVTISQTYQPYNWIFGKLICQISAFVQGTSVCVSVLSLTAISIDRYFIICKPLKVRTFYTNKKVWIIIVMIWLLSIAVMSPLLFVYQVKLEHNKWIELTMCIEHWSTHEKKLVFEVFIFLVMFLLPVGFMIYAFATIAKKLWKNDEPIFQNQFSKRTSVIDQKVWTRPPKINRANVFNTIDESIIEFIPQVNLKKKESGKDDLRINDRDSEFFELMNKRKSLASNITQNTPFDNLLIIRRRVVKMVIIVFAFFTVSWLPYHVITLAIDILVYKVTLRAQENNSTITNSLIYDKDAKFLSEQVYPITLCLALSNSAINAILFCIFNAGFRKILALKWSNIKKIFSK